MRFEDLAPEAQLKVLEMISQDIHADTVGFREIVLERLHIETEGPHPREERRVSVEMGPPPNGTLRSVEEIVDFVERHWENVGMLAPFAAWLREEGER